MRGGLIIWDAAKLAHLADMIRMAREEGLEKVPFCNVPPSRFRATVTHQFEFEEARRLHDENKALLDANPQPKFPENREGEEP